ncbi:MAG: carboxylating nicotinate-nucleotide diphosphorylase [Tenacibaculum sp.]
MISVKQFNKEVDLIISNAIREDIGEGDHSSISCIPAQVNGKAKLLVKDAGVIAGVDFAKKVFKYIDKKLQVSTLINDGEQVKQGDAVFYVSGSSRSILQVERIVLNAMQRMSGIASKTRTFVNLLKGTKTKVLDTRKTTPGFRAIEKWAVRLGGGENHRFALYDMIMIKDNHIDFAGGITKAINKTKQYLTQKKLDIKIIVEARNLKEVNEILSNKGVYRILLDNFNYADTRKAVELIGDLCFTESSGEIDETNLRNYADCGVDYISSGALTHSAHNMDLSLKALDYS